MVFGWKKKKTQNQESGQSFSIGKEISLSDIPKLLEEIKSLRTKTMISEIKSFRKNMEIRREAILKIAYELERDNLKVDDIDKHLQILVVRGKKLVISTIQKEALDKFPEVTSFDDISSLNSMLSQMLKRVGDVLGRQSRVIHIFAKKYAIKLKEHLAVLNSEKENLQRFLTNYDVLDNDISLIIEKIESYNNSLKLVDETKTRLAELKNSVQSYAQTIESTNQKIANLKSSKEHTKFLEIKKEIQSLSSQESQIKNQIDLQFTKISRPLSKYEYISSLEKPEKKLLEGLVNNPFNVLFEGNKENIAKILYAVRRGVESGSVSVKDSGKSVSQIDETIGVLDNLIGKIDVFMKQKNSLEQKLEIFNVEKLNEEESFLNKTESNKKDAESKIQNLEKKADETSESLPKTILYIEEKLRNVSKTKYHISI
jgi:hypothetical protein